MLLLGKEFMFSSVDYVDAAWVQTLLYVKLYEFNFRRFSAERLLGVWV